MANTLNRYDINRMKEARETINKVYEYNYNQNLIL